MENYIEVDEVFELNGKNYITLDETNYNGNRYIFANVLDNDNPTGEFVPFLCKGEKLYEVEDKKTKVIILTAFSNNMNKKLEVINNYYMNRGNKDE